MNKNCKYTLNYFTGHRNYSDANILNPKLSNHTRFCSNRQLPYFHNVDVDANHCTFSAFKNLPGKKNIRIKTEFL